MGTDATEKSRRATSVNLGVVSVIFFVFIVVVVIRGFYDPLQKQFEKDEPRVAERVEDDSSLKLHPKFESEFASTMHKGWWHLGCTSDVSELLPFLRLFREENMDREWIIDIGANEGQTSEEILQTFGNIPYTKADEAIGVSTQYCKIASNPKANLLVVEPVPDNMNKIKDRASVNSWDTQNVKFAQVAVSDEDGETSFQLSNGSETGALAANRNANGQEITVEMVTLESLLNRYVTNRKVFILKIDCEGHDGKIIKKGIHTLSLFNVRYLVFEYHELWNNANSGSLEEVVNMLDEQNFSCFFVTDRRLIALNPWKHIYEVKMWSNVVCGHRVKSRIDQVVKFYNSANGHTGDAGSVDLFNWLFKDSRR